MKVSYKPSPEVCIEFEAGDQKDIFSNLAKLQEILGENTCGKCKKNNVVFQVRTVGKFTYYEIRCKDCKAVLQFGQSDAGIYPRRYKMNGTEPLIVDGKKVWLKDNGWLQYNQETGEMA
jgi:hypothetical protein